jgi:serine/threonine protein kinase
MQINSRTKELEWPEGDFSEELRDLIGKILNKDPDKRPTIREVL